MTLLNNALYLAWADTRARYKKSVLGPLWLTLGNLVGILGLSIVWARLLNENMRAFVPSLTIGMIIWQLISGSIGEGATTFIRQAGVLKNVAIPIWFFVVRAISRHVINLLHNLIIIAGVIWYFEYPITPSFLFVIPGIFLVAFNLLWMTYLLGMIGARFRDVEYLVNALLPLLFFISPVIFRPDRLPVNMEIIWLNPFSYFIEVVRAPFIGHIPSLKTYLVMVGLILVGTTISLIFHRMQGKRLTFWV